MTKLETEVRARRLTAVLEEALGDGHSGGLNRRIVDRLAETPRRGSRSLLPMSVAVAAGLLVVFAVAYQRYDHGDGSSGSPAGSVHQDPKPLAAAVLTLGIRCEDRGKTVPRRAGAGEGAAHRFEGRRLAWRLGDRSPDTVAALTRALAAGAAGNGERGAVPRQSPLVIAPGSGVCFGELIAATDAAMAAAFSDIRWQGVDTPSIMPKAVAEPVRGGDALVVPRARFCEPDDAPHESRPTFELHQDGRIVHAGETLFAPVAGQADDLEPVRARLLELRAAFVAQGELGQRSDGKARLAVPILVCADRWVEWVRVQRFLALALAEDIGFWKVEVAVTDRDLDVEPGDRSGK